MIKYLGLILCLFMIAGAVIQVGLSFYFDILSLLMVVGGALGYSLLKTKNNNYIFYYGDGAVYFGWLGTLIGLIALTGGKWDNWGDLEKMGSAFSVAMLSLFYGYIIKLITLALDKNNHS